MKIAGIIAEYNPFHNGHRYHLEQTRELGATHIVAVMSGSVVQRGDVAIQDKAERAQAALKNGADLVIELPCPYSCSSAERFAEAGVRLLVGLGDNVVQLLSFGSESGDITSLERYADLSEELEYSDKVKYFISEGLSYPAALSKAAEEYGLGGYLSSPNDILGVEYIKAARRCAPWMRPVCITRQGAQHDSDHATGNITSASRIRELLASGDDASAFMPCPPDDEPLLIQNAEKLVAFAIMTADGLSDLPDMSENLVQRFLAKRAGFTTVSDYAEAMKNKSVTMARIRRILLYLVLGVRASDLCPVPYGRILGLNDRGREILSCASEKNRLISYDTSLARLETVSPQAKRVAELEQRASVLQHLCTKGTGSLVNEYTRRITLTPS